MSTLFKIFLFSFLIFSLANCQSEKKTSEETTPTTTTTNEKPSKEATPTQLLQGRWENISSDKEFLIIKDQKMIRRFAGATVKDDIITNTPFEFFEKCHSPCQIQSTDPDVSKFKCFTLKEEGSYNCYKVIRLDEDELHYSLMDGTGPHYSYKRVKKGEEKEKKD